MNGVIWGLCVLVVVVASGLAAWYFASRWEGIRRALRQGQHRLSPAYEVLRGSRSFGVIAAEIAGRVADQMIRDDDTWRHARFKVGLPEDEYGVVSSRVDGLKKEIFRELSADDMTPADLALEIVPDARLRTIVVSLQPDLDDGTSPPPRLDKQREVAAVLLVGAASEKVDVFEGDRLVVGRSDDEDVAITILGDSRVGGTHLVLDARDPGRLVVGDLGSAHGTFVNNVRVSSQVLASGDVVTFGNSQIIVDFLAASALRRVVEGGPARGRAEEAFPFADVESFVGKDVESLSPRSSPWPRGEEAFVEDRAATTHHQNAGFRVEPDKSEGVRRADQAALPSGPAKGPSISASATPSVGGIDDTATAPLRELLADITLGTVNGVPLTWAIDGDSIGNTNLQVWGASGSGKSRFTMALLRQIPLAARLLIVDPKGEYSDGQLDGTASFNPWSVPLPYNPLSVSPRLGPRGVERTVIELRDAIAQACGSVLGHRQLARLTEALGRVVGAGTLDDLNALLDSELRAAIGDLTGRQLFGDGPPLGTLVQSRSVVNLGDVPGDGRTKVLFSAFVLAAVSQHLTTLDDAPHAFRGLVVADEAHRLTRLRPLEVIAREARAKGWGLLLCSQLHADLPIPIAAQMGTTVCFRLPGSHAASAAEHLGFSELAVTIRSLETGEAVIVQGRQPPVVVRALQAEA